MNSCLYECEVMHHRVHPKVHAFRYSLFMAYLDLDELKKLHDAVPCFSYNQGNLYSFKEQDHYPEGGIDLRESLALYLRSQGVMLEKNNRVCLLTLPRVLGYVFNPVSFYFVFDSAGSPLYAVAEVGNTFKEKKLYLVPPSASEPGKLRCQVPKHFYVSPFSNLELEFDFKLDAPSGVLDIQINDIEKGHTVLFSRLSGNKVEFTNTLLLWFLIKYPCLTLLVIGRIHWQAALLFLKRIPFYKKAENHHLQREVLNPHSSSPL